MADDGELKYTKIQLSEEDFSQFTISFWIKLFQPSHNNTILSYRMTEGIFFYCFCFFGLFFFVFVFVFVFVFLGFDVGNDVVVIGAVALAVVFTVPAVVVDSVSSILL